VTLKAIVIFGLENVKGLINISEVRYKLKVIVDTKEVLPAKYVNGLA
jgi:hypothetical protein